LLHRRAMCLLRHLPLNQVNLVQPRLAVHRQAPCRWTMTMTCLSKGNF
jgi:hypothetical protein